MQHTRAKKVFIVVLLAALGIGIYRYGGTIYGLARWNLARPELYRMRVSAERFDAIWQWEVVVRNNDVVSLTKLESAPLDSYLTEEELTVDRLIILVSEYCFEQPDECILDFDNDYYYPVLWGSSTRSIRIHSFQECVTVEDCLQG
jgi:hypothetical protein